MTKSLLFIYLLSIQELPLKIHRQLYTRPLASPIGFLISSARLFQCLFRYIQTVQGRDIRLNFLVIQVPLFLIFTLHHQSSLYVTFIHSRRFQKYRF
jgi:hypothetical protein